MKKFTKFFGDLTDRFIDYQDTLLNSNKRELKRQEKLSIKLKKQFLSSSPENPTSIEQIKKILSGKIILNYSILKKNDKFKDINLTETEMKLISESLKDNATIKHLIFSNLKLTNESLKLLFDSLSKNQSVEVLHIDRNSFTEEKLEETIASLEQHANFEELNFSMNNFKDKGLEIFADCLGKMSNAKLKKIHFANCNYSSKGLQSLLKSLEKVDGLEYLDVGENHISDQEGMKALSEFLGKKKSLKVIRLSGIVKKDSKMEEFGSFTDVLKENTTLKEIRLNGNHLMDEDAKQLGEMLKENKGLEVLKLSVSDFSDQGIMDLCAGLKENKTLKHLRMLFISNITEKGIEHIVNALEGNESVTEFAISGKVGEKNLGVAHLTSLLEKNNTLETLEVGEFDDEGIIQLIPGLEKNTSLKILAVEKRSGLKKENRKKVQDIIKKRNKEFVF